MYLYIYFLENWFLFEEQICLTQYWESDKVTLLQENWKREVFYFITIKWENSIWDYSTDNE